MTDIPYDFVERKLRAERRIREILSAREDQVRQENLLEQIEPVLAQNAALRNLLETCVKENYLGDVLKERQTLRNKVRQLEELLEYNRTNNPADNLALLKQVEKVSEINAELQAKVDKHELTGKLFDAIISGGRLEFGPALVPIWMEAMEAADPDAWHSLRAWRRFKSSTELKRCDCTSGGLEELVVDLLSHPGTDKVRQIKWNRLHPNGDPLHGQFPKRFPYENGLTCRLNDVGKSDLLALISRLTSGLAWRSKGVLTVEASFLIYGEDALWMLSYEPGKVLQRLVEEVDLMETDSRPDDWATYLQQFPDRLEIHRACTALGVHGGYTPEAFYDAYRLAVSRFNPEQGGDVERFNEAVKAYELLSSLPKERRVF